MVMPKNLKTDWGFLRCVKQQFRTQIPAFPAKCEVTFFRNTTRWNCQSLKKVFLPDCSIDTWRWDAT